MMAVVSKRAELRPYNTRLADIRALAESCGRQLGAWLRTVKEPRGRATGSSSGAVLLKSPSLNISHSDIRDDK